MKDIAAFCGRTGVNMKTYADFYKSAAAEKNCYFIGANTRRGFSFADKSIFREEELTRLYIIKGGPGTGKSSFMKKIYEKFKADCEVTAYYCSSDPDSLDAVFIKKNGHTVAIADGTAPHVLEASLPGAVSEYLNLGDFWDSSTLLRHRLEIAKLAGDKSKAFEKAERFIASATEVSSLMAKAALGGYLEKKADDAISRILSRLPRQTETPVFKNVYTYAISMKGAVHLSTFKAAKHLIAIEDFAHLAPAFTEALSLEAKRLGHSVYLSRTPLGDAAEIYLPCCDTAFVPFEKDGNYESVIRLKRFADSEYFSHRAGKRHFNEKCLTNLLSGALSALREANEYHFALEDLYSASMDFTRLYELINVTVSSIGLHLSPVR